MRNIWRSTEDWKRRVREFDALLGAEIAKLSKRRGQTLTDEERRSLALAPPRPPDWAIFWDEMMSLPHGPAPAKNRAQKLAGAPLLIMALLQSDVPLSSPMRMYIALKVYQNWVYSEPIRARRRYRRSVAEVYKREKRELLKAYPGMSKAKAEREVAKRNDITVEAMRKRLQRATNRRVDKNDFLSE